MSNGPHLDLSFNWLPFTPNRDFLREPKILARAKGMFYYDPLGRPIIDGSSGLFAVAACKVATRACNSRVSTGMIYSGELRAGSPARTGSASHPARAGRPAVQYHASPPST